MKLTPNSFFNGDFQEVNLNNLFTSVNIYGNKPELMQECLDKWHDFTYNHSYGGYGENRKDMWRGTYIEESKKYYHLGIDINVPAGTPIKCPFDGQVIDILKDKDLDIGWGGRIIIESHNHYIPFLILAHLNPKTITRHGFLKKGDILGKVGTWPTNGNVFEHLHIQCLDRYNNNEKFDYFDGYGFKKDLKNNPNPFNIEW